MLLELVQTQFDLRAACADWFTTQPVGTIALMASTDISEFFGKLQDVVAQTPAEHGHVPAPSHRTPSTRGRGILIITSP